MKYEISNGTLAIVPEKEGSIVYEDNEQYIIDEVPFLYTEAPKFIIPEKPKSRKRSKRTERNKYGIDPSVGKISWRRKWQHTPVFLSGKCHGQKSLADMTGHMHTHVIRG